MFFIKKQIGFSLIEITVVLLILVALAGVAIPYISGTGSTALCNATDVTMQNVKKVIMERYYLDTSGYFPKDTKDTVENYNLKYLFTKPSAWQSFDPETQIGWRGSYLQGGMVLKSGENYSAANLNASFKSSIYVHDANLTDAIHPLEEGDTVVLDGWGRPIILQVPNVTQCDVIMSLSGTKEGYCARLVSAGTGSGTGIGEADIKTAITGNRTDDDRVLYLNAPTPAADSNPSCTEN